MRYRMMRTLRIDAPLLLLKHLWLFLALLLLVTAAARSHAAEVVSATGVMERGEVKFRSIVDYQCVADVQSNLGKATESGTVECMFKQPRMLRLKIIRGSKKGSVVAVDSQGQVRGHKGGILKSIVRRMTSNDPRLLTIRGTSLLTLDWGSFFLKYHAGRLLPGAEVKLMARAHVEAPYEVAVTFPLQGKAIREVYTIDPARWIIVEGAVYENEDRIEHVVFREVRLNTGVADSQFRL